MPHEKNPGQRTAVRVGALLLASIAVLGAAVLLIGDRRNLFERKNRYYIDLLTVSGLKPGNPVQLNGVGVGQVQKIVLPEDPAVENIRVWIEVDRSYEDRIRAFPDGKPLPGPKGDLPYSEARIKTLGLLGDKFIELTSGSAPYPKVESEGKIPAGQLTSVDALVASGEDVMSNVVEISHSLSNILSRMERGEGLLGELTSESPNGKRLSESMVGTFEATERIANRLDSGEGPLPRLLNDKQLADRLAGSLDRFDRVLASAEAGPGLLPGLLNDPQAKQKFDETLASLRTAAQNVERFSGNLEQSDALVPKLLKDEAYGRKVTADLSSLVEQLNEVSLRLSHGEGTAAKLINDPQIYDAVNDIMIGVEESKLLRWLIRNRQKAGIKKRYEDAQKAPPATGAPMTPATPEDTEAAPATPEPSAPPPDSPQTVPPTAEAPAPPPVPPVDDPAPPPPSGPREE
ncbi:MAG TPA: MlaD family protein [Thermoanaerobaculia bacterium]|jgi:phospholipid/cholesterol/gamma-HCH transport system substrate-binding protein|nr:MlaD family protein [Thermoanaerobaculia bacterium]